MRNKIFNLFAHQKVESKYLQSLSNYIATRNSASTDFLIREKELKAHIDNEVRALSPKMRAIFALSRTEELSYEEIAKKLNTSKNNVSKQVNNALRILKTKIAIVIYVCLLFKS